MIMRKSLTGTAALASTVVLLLGSLHASADDKAQKAPAGTWAKKGGEMKIEFAKDVVRIIPHGSKDVIVVVCKCTFEKGAVKAKITDFEGAQKDKVKDVIPAGLEFTFKWKEKDGSAALEEVKSSENVDILKSHLEGEYGAEQ
jgi:hypothetical protein